MILASISLRTDGINSKSILLSAIVPTFRSQSQNNKRLHVERKQKGVVFSTSVENTTLLSSEQQNRNIADRP